VKALYDTCIYVDFLRSGKHGDLLSDRNQFRYLSPVVILELMAGAHRPIQQRALDRLFLPYSKAARIVRLDPNHYYKAGQCLAALRGPASKTLSHDILIAISALSIGATLFTSNRGDFEKIRRHVPFRVEYV